MLYTNDSRGDLDCKSFWHQESFCTIAPCHPECSGCSSSFHVGRERNKCQCLFGPGTIRKNLYQEHQFLKTVLAFRTLYSLAVPSEIVEFCSETSHIWKTYNKRLWLSLFSFWTDVSKVLQTKEKLTVSKNHSGKTDWKKFRGGLDEHMILSTWAPQGDCWGNSYRTKPSKLLHFLQVQSYGAVTSNYVEGSDIVNYLIS